MREEKVFQAGIATRSAAGRWRRLRRLRHETTDHSHFRRRSRPNAVAKEPPLNYGSPSSHPPPRRLTPAAPPQPPSVGHSTLDAVVPLSAAPDAEMLSPLLLEYISFIDDHPYHQTQQAGNMALFVTMFLICCIEVIVVKIITEEDRLAAEAAEAAVAGESVILPGAPGGPYNDFR